MSYEAGVTEDGNNVLNYLHEVGNPDSDYEDPTKDMMNMDVDDNGGEVVGNQDTSDDVEENPSQEFDENPVSPRVKHHADSTDRKRKREMELSCRLLDKLEALIKTFPS
jgi:hypothetical protein